MQPDCDGNRGGVCRRCGHFDFLPVECTGCHQLFCGAHAEDHACALTVETNAEAAEVPTESPRATDDAARPPNGCTHHCVICGSDRCILVPCPRCSKDYCAEHRYHGHEEADDQGRRRHQGEESKQKQLQQFYTGSREAPASLTSVGDGALAAAVNDRLQRFCDRHHPANRLTIVPRYTNTSIQHDPSRTLVALFVDSQLFPPPTPEPSDDDPRASPPLGPASLHVAFLSVASAMSIGQLYERLVEVLNEEAGAAGAPQRSALTRICNAASIGGPDAACEDEIARGAAGVRLGLAVLEPSHLVRAAVAADDILVLTPAITAAELAHVTQTLEALLLSPSKAPSPISKPGASLVGTGSDRRLHSLGVKLRIKLAREAMDSVRKKAEEATGDLEQLSKASLRRLGEAETTVRSAPSQFTVKLPAHAFSTSRGPIPPSSSEPQSAEGASNVPSQQPLSEPAVVPTTADRPTGGVAPAVLPEDWPFVHPPPLPAIPLSATRSNPKGIAACRASVRPILVVVFIADRGASHPPYPPFCLAVMPGWSYGRLLDRIADECGAAAGPLAVKGKAVFDLVSGTKLAPSSDGSFAAVHKLRDSDILFVGSEYPTSLRHEVDRIGALKGRESAAVQMKCMKECVLM